MDENVGKADPELKILGGCGWLVVINKNDVPEYVRGVCIAALVAVLLAAVYGLAIYLLTTKGTHASHSQA